MQLRLGHFSWHSFLSPCHLNIHPQLTNSIHHSRTFGYLQNVCTILRSQKVLIYLQTIQDTVMTYTYHKIATVYNCCWSSRAKMCVIDWSHTKCLAPVVKKKIQWWSASRRVIRQHHKKTTPTCKLCNRDDIDIKMKQNTVILHTALT